MPFRFIRSIHRRVGVPAVMLLLTACAVSIENIEPEAERLDRYSQLPSVQALEEVEAIFSEARKQELQRYAPEHVNVASRALEEARQVLSQNGSSDKVARKAAVAETILREGNRVMARVKKLLSRELAVKEQLDRLEAPVLFSSEYAQIEETLATIINKVENGKTVDEEREQLGQQLQALYIRSVHRQALGEAEDILTRVRYRGGERLAPRTFEEAVRIYQSADKFIRETPHDQEGIDRLAAEALFAAKRALHVADEVAALSHTVNQSLEQVILDEEYRLSRIGRALGTGDLRNQPLEAQSELLARQITELRSQSEDHESLAMALRDALVRANNAAPNEQLAILNSTIARLKKEQDEWLAKEALFKAKLFQLEGELRGTTPQVVTSQLPQGAIGGAVKPLTARDVAKARQENSPPPPRARLKPRPVANSGNGATPATLTGISRPVEPARPLQSPTSVPAQSDEGTDKPRKQPSLFPDEAYADGN